jgi:hypothetical protein
MLKNINDVWSKLKTHLIYILIICLLVGALSISVSKCSNTSGEYKHNIEALKDTIKYYQDKNGNLVATKLAFESDIETLKLLNEDLYNQIDSLKLKPNNIAQIIQIGGEIENPDVDTAYIIKHDTIAKGFNKDFNFNNKYRVLEGNVNYDNDSLGVHITKDVINFDYTVAMDKDSRIYVKSTNPYVKYNEISGFTIPKQKKKRWNIGPAVNVGYDPINKNWAASAGISLTYGIIQW